MVCLICGLIVFWCWFDLICYVLVNVRCLGGGVGVYFMDELLILIMRFMVYVICLLSRLEIE